tara:strand:+ start:1051 stop:1653 length:603 start_codon:yes stop_codon:yes gene_type:complete
MKNNKPRDLVGLGRNLIFSLKKGELFIYAHFTLNTESKEVKTTFEAIYQDRKCAETRNLGVGTFEECYELCVAEKSKLEAKVYNWENCVDSNGWYIDIHNKIKIGRIEIHDDRDRNYYPTKEDAESALAYCQLLHIVNKINEDYPIDATHKYKLYYEDNEFKLSYITGRLNWGGLVLSEKGAEILIRDNEELLKTYFKIK